MLSAQPSQGWVRCWVTLHGQTQMMSHFLKHTGTSAHTTLNIASQYSNSLQQAHHFLHNSSKPVPTHVLTPDKSLFHAFVAAFP